jgi:hypothetical protein
VVEPLPAETPPADTLAGRNLATLLALPPSSPGLWSEAELRGVLASARSGRELPVLAETE